MVAYHSLDGSSAPLNSVTACRRQPLARSLREEAVRFDHLLTAKANRIVIQRRFGSHHSVERRTVPIRGPYLEAILGPPAECFGICNKRLESHGRLGRAHREQLRETCIEQ